MGGEGGGRGCWEGEGGGLRPRAQVQEKRGYKGAATGGTELHPPHCQQQHSLDSPLNLPLR